MFRPYMHVERLVTDSVEGMLLDGTAYITKLPPKPHINKEEAKKLAKTFLAVVGGHIIANSPSKD